MTYLKKRQAVVNTGEPVQRSWAAARRTKSLKNNVFETLVAMSGARARCYFCNDSRGTDIDHFWPKRRYSERVFEWSNMLLVCSGCNRKKADQFPLDQDGHPLLIDPTKEDPWDYLFFEPATGQVVARWDLQKDAYDPKGTVTTDERILPLNVEAVTEGRKRVVRRLVQAVRSYILEPAEPDKSENAFNILQRTLNDNDDYGLTYWFFMREGQHAEPFKTLHEQYPKIWERLQVTLDDFT
jgi:uncharacterized protein (TIGR02646 family)